jgi:hypothetical protein
MNPDKRNFVDAQTLHTYNDIDIFKVIEEVLLFQGTDAHRKSMTLRMSDIERTCLIVYNLKVNATNKLYVGMHLDKQVHRNDLRSNNGTIKIPRKIFDKVDEIHKQYQKN